MSERWIWAVRYGIVIAVAVILAVALGEMELFKTTRFGKTGLNASRVVQFFGFGGALLVFWLLAQRAAAQFSESTDGSRLLKSIVLPIGDADRGRLCAFGDPADPRPGDEQGLVADL